MGREGLWFDGGGSSSCNGGIGGTFQRAVGAGPTSGGDPNFQRNACLVSKIGVSYHPNRNDGRRI